MGSLYAKDVIDNAWSNVGAVCGKTNEYSAELDSIDYFNGKKNGVANSCSIFLCDMTYRSTRNASLETDPDKWDAYYFLFQPSNPASNCGAGCTQQAGYFKNGGAWFTDPSEAERGDWIFFTNDGGETFYHVGLIVSWGEYVEELGTSDAFTTIEGNTNGGYVAYHYYRYDDSRIGGFGRPRYDGFELPSSEKEPPTQKEDPKPEPTPAPEPKPEPKVQKFKVVTRYDPLRLRSAPNTDSACLDLIPKGTIIEVSQFVEGEMINWNTTWARTTYNGRTGYCSANYLEEV